MSKLSDHAEIQRPIATGVTEPWQWLTQDEIIECAKWADKYGHGEWHLEFARAVQKMCKEKNQ